MSSSNARYWQKRYIKSQRVFHPDTLKTSVGSFPQKFSPAQEKEIDPPSAQDSPWNDFEGILLGDS